MAPISHSTFSLRPPGPCALDAIARPSRVPVASQIRSYYQTLQSEYMRLQRQEALSRVQQALEPLTVTLISTCGG